MTKRARRCRVCWTRSDFSRGMLVGHSDGASIATIYAGTHPGSPRARARADGAAFHRRGCERRSRSREARDAYAATAICARELAALASRMSTTRSAAGTMSGSIPASAQWDITRGACLYPRADPDRAGRGRSVRHPAPDRDRARGMLLPGRGRAVAGREASAASRRRRRRRCKRSRISSTASCAATRAASARLTVRSNGSRSRPAASLDWSAFKNSAGLRCNMHYSACHQNPPKNGVQGWPRALASSLTA